MSTKSYEVPTDRPALVTGATGYVAGWIVKRLLDAGATVHAAVRNPSDESKVRHLNALVTDAPGNIRYFKADLLESGSFREAMDGCGTVFHTASPFSLHVEDPQRDLIDPALRGTTNVLEQAVSTPSVARVVVTSSYFAATGDNADLKDTGKPMVTEEDWNTTSSLAHQPYAYSKTVAEREAWRIADSQKAWRLTTVNPVFILGPGISPHATSESFRFVKNYADGSLASGVPDYGMSYVDVRDVAEGHLRAAFCPDAEGRHLLVGTNSSLPHLAEVLRKNYGAEGFRFPKRVIPKPVVWLFGPLLDRSLNRKVIARNVGYPLLVDNAKSVRELGMSYRPFEETVTEMFQQMIDAGTVSLANSR